MRDPPPPSDARSAAAVAFMFIFTDAFTLGILPVSWSYSSEIQPLSTRNKATSVRLAALARCCELLIYLDAGRRCLALAVELCGRPW